MVWGQSVRGNYHFDEMNPDMRANLKRAIMQKLHNGQELTDREEAFYQWLQNNKRRGPY